MIRVTSGYAKGKKLLLPKTQKVTAVKEVVKLAVFSIIGEKIHGATCLDLYAGSGNMGIEALSRGAVFCDFVDENKTAIDTMEINLRNTGFIDHANPIWDDSLKFLSNIESQYDIIFADPYYAETNHRHLVKLAIDRLKPHGLFFLLTSSKETVKKNRHSGKSPRLGGGAHPESDSGLRQNDILPSIQTETRRYGKTLLTIFQKP